MTPIQTDGNADKHTVYSDWLLVFFHTVRSHFWKSLASYPVLLVLFLVFGISVHVGAHTGVAGGAGDTADAVGGVLPPDAQVWLLVVL